MCRCTTRPNIVDTFGYIPGQVKFSVEPALVRSWHWNSKVPSSWIYRPRGFGEYMGSVPPRTRGCRPLEFAQVRWIAFVRASLTTGLMMLNGTCPRSEDQEEASPHQHANGHQHRGEEWSTACKGWRPLCP